MIFFFLIYRFERVVFYSVRSVYECEREPS